MSYSRKKKFNPKKTRKARKGGFTLFKKISRTTQEDLINLQNKVGNIKIKEFEEIIRKNIENIGVLAYNCNNKCKSNICTKHDRTTCLEINSMIENKPIYDWSNFCNNATHLAECNDYLKMFKELEFSVNYINSLSNKATKLLQDYKESTIHKTKSIDTNYNSEFE
jgi:hypothetical protein